MTNKMFTVNNNYLDDTFGDFSKTIRDSIRNIIKQEKFLKCSITKKQVPQVGNFLSSLYEVDVTGETADGVKVTQLFIKKSITLDKTKIVSVTDAYSREHFIYNELSRIFVKLQDAANVPHAERFRFLKSYDCGNEAIIMENLRKKGFKSYDGTQVITLKFAELSIVELAKFHAFSFVLKRRQPKYFDTKIKIMKQPFHLDNDWVGFVNNVCSVAAQVVNGTAQAKVKEYAPRMIQTYQKYIKDTVPSNGCLCHGDYKILNILVKEVDGVASAVQPIDYQLVYHGHPVDDLLFFLFTGTDREFRRKHLSHLKDLYFKSFAKFLRHFDIDVDSAYSRREFAKDYEERLELGLVFGLFMSAVTFAHIGEGFDLSKLSLSELQIIPDEKFTERVRGIVEDYTEWGYL